jgi:2'-5' RNA ligase
MANLVVVALPSADDRVWKISSEKVPHMTILFLGEMPVQNFTKIASFVEHAAKQSLNRFGMEVDRRGVLGDEGADVLFFDKTKWGGYPAIAEFRSYLLQDDNIRAAYQAVEQYPEWLPHLTLGFPETPAKKDDQDYKLSYVDFDRIALWFNDYEGFEYSLKKHEWEDLAEVGMSSTMITGWTATAQILHAGVKGMKWGVRKSNVPRPKNNFSRKQQVAIVSTGGFAFLNKGVREAYNKNYEGAKVYRTAKKQEKAGRAADKKTARVKKWNREIDTKLRKDMSDPKFRESLKKDLHRSTRREVRKEVTRINNKPEYKKAYYDDVFENSKHPTTKKYHSEINQTYLKKMNDFLANDEYLLASGNLGLKAELTPNRNADPWKNDPTVFSLRLIESKASHADDSIDFMVRYVQDDKGLVTDFELLNTSMVQGELLTEHILLHAGIKGMKWGVRKDRGAVTVRQKGKKLKTSGGAKLPAHPDAIRTKGIHQVLKKSGIDALSNQDLQAYSTRLNLEAGVKRLNDQKRPAAKKFITKLLGQEVKTAVTTVADEAVSQQVKRFMNKTKLKPEEKKTVGFN